MGTEQIDVLVLTALPDELSALRVELGREDEQDVGPNDLFSYVVWRDVDLGTSPGSGSLVAVMPPQKDQLPAADAIYRALTIWSPRCFALVGIAGQLGTKVKLGDVIVGRHVLQWDAQRTEEKSGASYSLTPAPSAMFGVNLANLLKSDAERYQRWKEDCARNKPPELDRTVPDLYTEDVASGSATIDSKDMHQMLSALSRHLYAVETEAAAALRAFFSVQRDGRSILIRGISDLSAGKSESDAVGEGAWRKYAARNAAKLLVSLLTSSQIFSAKAIAKTPRRPAEPKTKVPQRKSKGVEKLDDPRSVKTSLAHSDLWASFHRTRAQIHANVHADLAVKSDRTIDKAFEQLNERKRIRFEHEHYNLTRFRLVHAPRKISRGTEIELALAPIDFACVALLKDPETSTDVKRYVMRMIAKTDGKSPHRPRSKASSFGFPKYDLLGTQICLITKDGRTLFRERGASVLFAKHRWDVSVSGFCGESDIVGSYRLDVGFTVQHETRREIGVLRGDPRQIYFTGLHRNTRSGAIDLLAYWKIETTSQELAEVIGVGKGTRRGVFRTKNKAIEVYVWDTRNLIVDFGASAIGEALYACGIGVSHFEPQSWLCTQLALQAFHDSGGTVGISDTD